jgi:hypothetical protein
MADKPKLVRGTLDNGAVVETTKENAERLGARFTTGGDTKSSSSSKSSK